MLHLEAIEQPVPIRVRIVRVGAEGFLFVVQEPIEIPVAEEDPDEREALGGVIETSDLAHRTVFAEGEEPRTVGPQERTVTREGEGVWPGVGIPRELQRLHLERVERDGLEDAVLVEGAAAGRVVEQTPTRMERQRLPV